MPSFKNDFKAGIANEKRVLPIVKQFFDSTIKLTEPGCRYDYISDTGMKLELKTRNVSVLDYPTTLIPASKLIYNDLVLLFDFNDGLYFIKYEPKLFMKFKREMYCRNRRTDYRDVPAEYVYIPTTELQRIN